MRRKVLKTKTLLGYKFTSEDRISAILFCAVFALYISFLPRLYNYDGVSCAMAVSMESARKLFHGNHLLYAFAGMLFHSLLRVLGLYVREIDSLQTMNCLMAAFSAVIFFRMGRVLLGGIIPGLGYSLGLVFSFCFWLWHGEAQVYPFGFIFLVWASSVLFTEELSKKKYLKIGFLHAFACLGHVAHLIWFPVTLFYIVTEQQSPKTFPRLRTAVLYGAALAIPLMIVYGLMILLVVKPASVSELHRYLAGSAALSGTFKWTSYPTIPRIIEWIKTAGETLYGSNLQETFWAPATTVSPLPVLFPLKIIMIMAFIGIAGTGVLTFNRMSNEKKRIITACGLWLLIYMLFFASWQPELMTYHLTDLIPIWICLMIGVDAWGSYRMNVIVPFVLAGGLFFLNFFGTVYPLSISNNNPLLKKMDFIRTTTLPDDIIIGVNGWDPVYVPYFAMRQYLSLNRNTDVIYRLLEDNRRNIQNIVVYLVAWDDPRLRDVKVFYTIQQTYYYDGTFSMVRIAPIYGQGT